MGEYKKVILNNDKISATIVLPDECKGFYRGARFDWSGMISSLSFNKHTFIEQPFFLHDPKISHCGIGTAEEFRACLPGMQDGLGFQEAKIGEGFIKIGVGVLEKDSYESYQFDKNYKILKVGEWKVSSDEKCIIFNQKVQLSDRHGYKYSKEIKLTDDETGLTIQHSLKNIGKERIDINHYCHNFFMVDGEFISRNYSATFPFEPNIINETFCLPEYIKQNGRIVSLNKNIEEEECFVGGDILGFNNIISHNRFRIENGRTGAGIEISSSVPTVGIFLAMGKRYFSVESQVDINIKYNEIFLWENKYKL